MVKILRPIIAVVFFSVMLPQIAWSDITDREEALAFASFIKDLIHGTQTSKSGTSICYVGSDEISRIIAEGDKGSIDVTRDLQKIPSCKAVYVSNGLQKGVSVELAKLNKYHVMTIAIFDEFTMNGGMVQVQLGRRNFELVINQKAMRESGIRLSGLHLGLVIN